jgi:hypothetical protein
MNKKSDTPMNEENKVEYKEDTGTDFMENYITKAETTLLPVKITPDVTTSVNRKIIDSKYYNSFNFSKLADAFSNGKITLGITSATSGEGKTLVAANMAVSLASAYNDWMLDTVLDEFDHAEFGELARQGLVCNEAGRKRAYQDAGQEIHGVFRESKGP